MNSPTDLNEILEARQLKVTGKENPPGLELLTLDLPTGGQGLLLRLDRPETKNALDSAMAETMRGVTAELNARPVARFLIITGRDNIFSAGGDFKMLRDFATRDYESNRRTMRAFYESFLGLRHTGIPLVSAVNGHAVGAGLCFALLADYRVVSHQAKLALNFVKLGIHPGMGASWLVPRLAGVSRAQDLLLSGRFFNAGEAHQWGLFQEAREPEEVLPAALDRALVMASAGPLALRLCRRGLNANANPGFTLEQALDYEAAAQAQCYQTEDYAGAIAAVTKKEAPVFRDE